ncbi:MAG: phosphate transport system substrate-binding protein [Mycobacterium sp.]|nr:phosphate transport system substrate-binding protein [Mycobacterium sp.]
MARSRFPRILAYEGTELNPSLLGACPYALATVALMLAGCGSGTGGGNEASAPKSPAGTSAANVSCGGKKTLKASGSTAQVNAMTRFVEAYEQTCPGQALDYTANGSGAGIREFTGSQTDFGGSDSPLNPSEYAAAQQRCGSPAWNLPAVFGPVAITYHVSGVSSLILDGPTAAKIFNGTITSWNDPAMGNDGTAAAVKRTDGAISYNEWSFAQAEHLDMAQIITSAGPEPVSIGPDSVAKTIASAWIINNSNDLVLDTISFYRPNQAGSYPIVLATYEIVCSKYADAQVGGAVKAFLQSTIGAGQNGLADNGYVPIPDAFKSRLSTAVNAIS